MVCSTFFLREVLEKNLKQMPWQGDKMTTMWDYYQQLWVPFGELLTDIERTGIKVDLNHLHEVEPIAIKDKHDRVSKYSVIFVGNGCLKPIPK